MTELDYRKVHEHAAGADGSAPDDHRVRSMVDQCECLPEAKDELLATLEAHHHKGELPHIDTGEPISITHAKEQIECSVLIDAPKGAMNAVKYKVYKLIMAYRFNEAHAILDYILFPLIAMVDSKDLEKAVQAVVSGEHAARVDRQQMIEALAEFTGIEPKTRCSGCEGTGRKHGEEFGRTCRWCDGNGKQDSSYSGFAPLENWNHTWYIIKRLQELGFYYELTNSYHSKPTSCRIWNRKGVDITEYGEQQECICQAAYSVITSLPNNSHV